MGRGIVLLLLLLLPAAAQESVLANFHFASDPESTERGWIGRRRGGLYVPALRLVAAGAREVGGPDAQRPRGAAPPLPLRRHEPAGHGRRRAHPFQGWGDDQGLARARRRRRTALGAQPRPAAPVSREPYRARREDRGAGTGCLLRAPTLRARARPLAAARRERPPRTRGFRVRCRRVPQGQAALPVHPALAAGLASRPRPAPRADRRPPHGQGTRA